jgi:hypothetical protein
MRRVHSDMARATRVRPRIREEKMEDDKASVVRT